jgi:hypothetical protein
MLLAVLYSLLVAVGRPCPARAFAIRHLSPSHFSSHHTRPHSEAGTTLRAMLYFHLQQVIMGPPPSYTSEERL